MRKTAPVAFITQKIRFTNRQDLIAELENLPLKDRDFKFMICIIKGLSYKELAQTFNVSESRIAKWKRELYEYLAKFAMQGVKR